MAGQSSHAVTCWHDGGGWAVEVPCLGLKARAPRYSEVETVARDLVVSFTQEDPESCRVAVELVTRHSVTELVAAAAALRVDPDEVSVEAVTLRRGLAQQLAAEGFEGADVAALLGLSHVRAVQLIGDRGHPAHRRLASERLAPPGLPGPVPTQRSPENDLPHPLEETDVTTSQRPHTTYRHEAFLYSGDVEFLAGTLSFVREGVELGQPVMVAVVPERLEPLRTALGDRADGVCWVDMAELGGNPARIIPAWRTFVDEHGGHGRPVRGVGEPVWASRRAPELLECQLHEALLNMALEPDTALWLRCPYDVDALPADVIEEASRSHPALVDGAHYQGSRLYGGASHARSMFTSELPPPSAEVERWEFDHGGLRPGPHGSTDVSVVRRAVQERAAAAGLGPAGRADLAVAVTEAATNSIQHGGGRGTLRVWRDEDALTCEIRDTGRISDPLVGRRMPPLGGQSGRGLWLVHQLSDLAQIRSTEAGSTVRITSWL
ncbi:MAG: anti-sigma factor RsbA family regulatory protein [Nocardioidaceae bacterium]